MKLKNRLIISYCIIAVFLVVALIIAYRSCEIICSMNSTTMESGMILFIYFSILALVIALCFSLWFAIKLSAPIKEVTNKTEAIANGNYDEKIVLQTNTIEIDRLISSVNNLAASLQLQQQIKKQMANNYAHELRTPLAIIQSNLEGLIDGVFEPTVERFESICAEILRLNRMVIDIEKLVELEDDKLKLNKELFDFEALLKTIIVTFEPEIKEKKISLRITTEPCQIFADKDKISSVLINLISNAVKYTNHNGKIEIKVHSENNNTLFTIVDDGLGIDESDLPHIFEHLYRADSSRARETGGYGIGLSVVKAIVVAHGGTIDVKSQKGTGSTFKISLPIS